MLKTRSAGTLEAACPNNRRDAIEGRQPLRLSKARTWPLLAEMNNSHSFRGSARTGATLGSISARSSFERTAKLDRARLPAAPLTATTRPARTHFRWQDSKTARAPQWIRPRSGSGSGCMPALRRNLTAGSLARRRELASNQRKEAPMVHK